MSEKNRVEIHDFKDWKAGVYLIEAGCGQGKNYFVFNTLFPYAHENGKRMLVFSNRVALREQQQAQTQEKDVKLITYQSLEHDEYLETMQDTKNKVRGLMQQVGEYDYIILDEAHYLYQDFQRKIEKLNHYLTRNQMQLKNGLDLYSVSRLMGHVNIMITQRYLLGIKDKDIVDRGTQTSPLMNL